MEKKKNVVENSNIIMNYSERSHIEEELANIQESRIFGWEDSLSVAKSIFCSIHEELLRGKLIFAYRTTSSSNKTSLFQIIVVNDIDERTRECTNKFSISTITSGYTSYIPHMPLNYLSEVVLKDLEEGKAEKRVIESFKSIIKGLEVEFNGKEIG